MYNDFLLAREKVNERVEDEYYEDDPLYYIKEKIWHHTLLEDLRERKLLMEKCHDCPELEVCGGGCPLAVSEEEVLYCMESVSTA